MVESLWALMSSLVEWHNSSDLLDCGEEKTKRAIRCEEAYAPAWQVAVLGGQVQAMSVCLSVCLELLQSLGPLSATEGLAWSLSIWPC